MAALVFFTSLFLLVALLSVTTVSGLFSGARRDSSRATTAKTRRDNSRATTGKKSASTKTGQATRKPRQKRQPSKTGGAAANSSRSRTASGKSRQTAAPRRGFRLRLPNLPLPPGLVSCLPLGLVMALMVGAGQLALYGLQQSQQGGAEDPRLAAFDGALDYLGVAALALVALGLVGAIASYRRKP